jgi:subtilisin family serine protease
MKKFVHSLGIVCVLWFIAPAGFAADRIIVKIRSSVNYQVNYQENKIITDNPALASAFNAAKITRITSVVPPAMNVSHLKSIAMVKHIHFFDLLPGTNIEEKMEMLRNTNLFEYVEADQPGEAGGTAGVTPNDTYFNRQWGLYNNGTFSGAALTPTVGADVKMTDAWTLTTGSSSVIVCILDSGLKLDHPEFSGRVWVNPGEISNGVDDDGNGYIDDINGWDFANNDNNPTDDHGHGTNVTGITAASGNNNSGYAGANWNCKIMTGKILSSTGNGLYSWWINGIYYAVAKGARVINMSVGGSSFSQAMQDACDFALANNVAIFACMMNTNNSLPYYPAAYASTIAVGATDVNDFRVQPFFWDATSGSNFGNHIDVVAPGNYIYGLSYNSNTNFNTYWGGTSQATPLVAGVASLMIALKPAITVNEIRTKLRSTATDLVGRAGEDLPGFDPYMGYGRVNAYAALSAVLPVIASRLEGSLQDAIVSLSWKTYQESNTDKFVVEVSGDLVNWTAIGQVKAKGNSSVTSDYSFHHEAPLKGISFYRYVQFDKDGKSELSNIVRIWNERAGFIIKGSTPSPHQLNLVVSSQQASTIKMFIYNPAGALVKTFQQQATAGSNYILLDIASLASGTYSLTAVNGKGETQSIKFIR